MPNEMPEMKDTIARLRTTQSVDSTDPSALQSEMLLVIGAVKKRNIPIEILPELLGSGRAAANMTFLVCPAIWRQGTSTAIQEDQRTFQS